MRDSALLEEASGAFAVQTHAVDWWYLEKWVMIVKATNKPSRNGLQVKTIPR